MLASELYAIANGTSNLGDLRCHYCGSPCKRDYIHNEPPPVPFVRMNSTVRCPASAYECAGCWLWRRQRITVNFLKGGLKDRECPLNHSWWITDTESKALRVEDYQTLYPLLLKPPRRFVLALLDKGTSLNGKAINTLHLAIANDLMEVKADTILHFTINGSPHTYTVYELEEAIRQESMTGREPGVQALIRFLGPYDDPHKNDPKKVGRPLLENVINDAKRTKRTIRMSGG